MMLPILFGQENAQILAGFMQEIFVGEFEIRGSAVNISRNGLQQGKPVAEMLAYILRLCREDIEVRGRRALPSESRPI